MAYYSEVEIPHDLGSSVFDGPVHRRVYDAGLREIENLGLQPTSITRTSGSEFVHPVSGFSTGSSLSYSASLRAIHGLVLQEFRRASSTVTYDTELAYDDQGRVRVEVNPNGTARRYTYDVRDRVIKEEVGTLTSGDAHDLRGTGTGNLVVVREYLYDSILPNGYANSPAIGNGALTRTIEHDTSTSTRTTDVWHDFRDRPVWRLPPLPPYERLAYDNLDRVTVASLYESAPTASGSASGSATEPTVADRGRLETYDYTQRGLLFRSRMAITPEIDVEGMGFAGFLAWHHWYDAEAREIALWEPNAPATKRAYDGLGRVTKESRSDRAGDAAPGASGTHAAAAALTGDVVLEQVSYAYFMSTSGLGDHLGAVQVAATRRRAHDSSHTGDLDGGDPEDVITSYVGYAYDDADRVIKRVDFGTSLSDDLFKGGGSAPSGTDIGAPAAWALVELRLTCPHGLVHRQS